MILTVKANAGRSLPRKMAGWAAVAALAAISALTTSCGRSDINKPAVSGASTVVPAVTYFNAADSSITAGQTTRLGWGVTGATTISIDNEVGVVTGTQVSVTPATTTTYTMTASNSIGTTTAKTTVTVLPAPKIVSFTASPSPYVKMGQNATLSWTVTGATKLSLTAAYWYAAENMPYSQSTDVSSFSSFTVSPGEQVSYTLTATNAAGVSVTSQPLVLNMFNLSKFVTDTYTVIPGGSGANLSWSGLNANSFTLQSTDTVTGAVTTQDVTSNANEILPVNPANTMKYYLTATDSSGDSMTSGPLIVTVDKSLRAINSFVANNPSNTVATINVASTSPGATVNLIPTFNSTDGNNVPSSNFQASILDDQGNPLYSDVTSGTSYQVNPQQTTTYTLSVSDGTDTQTKTVRVVVGDLSAFSGASAPYMAYYSPGFSGYGADCGPNHGMGPNRVLSTAALSQLCEPTTMTVDPSGNLYYFDGTFSDFVKVDTSGNESLVSETGGIAYRPTDIVDNVPLSQATFMQYGIIGHTFSPGGDLYITEEEGCEIRKISFSTPKDVEVTSFAGSNNAVCASGAHGDLDGQAAAAQFASSGQLLFDSAGDLIVGEECSVRAIDSSGNVVTIAGYDNDADGGFSGGGIGPCGEQISWTTPTAQDGSGSGIVFQYGINSMAIDSNDVIYINDRNRISKLTPDKSNGGTKASDWSWYLSTWINPGGSRGPVDGSASTAQFYSSNLSIDSGGSLYTFDDFNEYVKRIAPDGTVDTIAGTGTDPSYQCSSLDPNTDLCTYTPITVTAPLPGTLEYGGSYTPLNPVTGQLLFVPGDTAQIFAVPTK